jgi:hypothetical protein
MVTYYVGPLEDEQWRHVLSRALARADRFQAMMPEGEGMLSYGRTLFGALPNLTITPSTRMREAVVMSGELTTEIRDLIASTQTSLTGYDADADTRLWDYQLLSGEVEILSIGDYNDLILEVTDEDLAELESVGIASSGWDRIA